MKIADISTHSDDDVIDVRIIDDNGAREETYRGQPDGYLWRKVKPGEYRQVFRKPSPHERSATGADGIAVGVPKARPNQSQRGLLLKAIAGHLKAKIVTLHSFVLTEGETEYETIKAESMEAALDEAEANVDSVNYDWNDDGERASMFVEVSARHAKTGARASRTVVLDPDPPRCLHDDHKWETPHEIVGGLEENPGVVGSGGGIAFTKVCVNCGCGMHVDTWATNPANGTGGHRTVRYVPEEFVDEVAALDAKHRRVVILVDDVAIGDGQTEDAARKDVDETCIPSGYEDHEPWAETYDSRTHEVAMGPNGYMVLRRKG